MTEDYVYNSSEWKALSMSFVEYPKGKLESHSKLRVIRIFVTHHQ